MRHIFSDEHYVYSQVSGFERAIDSIVDELPSKTIVSSCYTVVPTAHVKDDSGGERGKHWCDGLEQPANEGVQPPPAGPRQRRELWARSASTTQKRPDLAREGGRLQRRVRRSGRSRSGCQPHVPTTPAQYHAGTTGVRSEPRPSGITPCTTGLHLNHAHRESRCP